MVTQEREWGRDWGEEGSGSRKGGGGGGGGTEAIGREGGKYRLFTRTYFLDNVPC